MSEQQLPPGGEGALTVKLSTEGKQGKVSKTVTVPSNDPTQPNVTLKVNADIDVPLLLKPTYVNLGELGAGASALHTLELSGRLAATTQITTVTAPPELTVTLEKAENTEANRVRLNITVKPDTAPDKIIHGTIELSTNSPEAPVVKATVHGRVVGKIYARPNPVNARPGDNDQPAKLQFDVLARDTKGFKVKSAADEQKRFTAKVTEVKASELYRIEADIPAALIGPAPLQGAVIVTTNNKDTPTLKIPFNVFVRTGRMAVPTPLPVAPGNNRRMPPPPNAPAPAPAPANPR